MSAIAEYSIPTSALTVNMGQAVIGRNNDVLSAVLGSCIGIAIYHPRQRVGALAHVVLPESIGRTGPPAKFADTVVPYLLHLFKTEGVSTAGLVAKLAGGANMFNSKGPIQVGVANLEAVTAALEQAGLSVAAQHTGGAKGRQVRFNCQTGELTIEIAGAHVATL